MPELETERNLNETVDRLLAVVARYRWWVLLPASLTIFGTLLVLSLMPNRYSSEATLIVVQQQIPERYVVPTTTTDISEALQATAEEVLSRSRMTEIIDEFDLYPKERKSLSPEGVLQLMRHDIQIQALEGQSGRRDVNSFKIAFTADKPFLAQEVTAKLTSLFIQQNVVTRERQATTTTNFLQEQLETAKNKLVEAEEQVRNFKLGHLGELPEQQQGNLAILSGLEAQLQSTIASLNRAREQEQYLESLSETRSMMIQGDLTRLEAQREALLRRYTPAYPTVKQLDIKIAQTQALLNTLLGVRRVGAEALTVEPSGSIGTAEDPSIAQISGQKEANRLEIENLSKDERQLRAAIAEYQNRLNKTPIQEQQLAGMLRNYDLLKQEYTDLLNKTMQSELAGDLEKRQEGQQFHLVDRPSLATVPATPNRIKISLGGVAAGLGLGVALAVLADFRDRSFHSEHDLSKRFPFPLVIGVPLLLTASEERARTKKRICEWIAGSGLAFAVLIAELYELYLYRHG